MAKVKGSAGGPLANISTRAAKLWELGLAEENILVVPNFKHRDMNTDDFGPDCPADVMALLADVNIFMKLIHYDDSVVDGLMAEALGGSVDPVTGVATPGTMVGAGVPLGGGVALGTKGNHYVSLNLFTATVNSRPWRFPASYLAQEPVRYPVGTYASVVELVFRAIPYVPLGTASMDPSKPKPELKSAGAILWDRTADIS